MAVLSSASLSAIVAAHGQDDGSRQQVGVVQEQQAEGEDCKVVEQNHGDTRTENKIQILHVSGYKHF